LRFWYLVWSKDLLVQVEVRRWFRLKLEGGSGTILTRFKVLDSTIARAASTSAPPFSRLCTWDELGTDASLFLSCCLPASHTGHEVFIGNSVVLAAVSFVCESAAEDFNGVEVGVRLESWIAFSRTGSGILSGVRTSWFRLKLEGSSSRS
jgi:hypothetical protein